MRRSRQIEGHVWLRGLATDPLGDPPVVSPQRDYSLEHTIRELNHDHLVMCVFEPGPDSTFTLRCYPPARGYDRGAAHAACYAGRDLRALCNQAVEDYRAIRAGVVASWSRREVMRWAVPLMRTCG